MMDVPTAHVVLGSHRIRRARDRLFLANQELGNLSSESSTCFCLGHCRDEERRDNAYSTGILA
jgi:hypothetical protein